MTTLSIDRQIYFDAITINETYFFRDPEQFRAFERLVLQRLLEGRPRIVSLWSAGCSTGGEPYTLAIIVDRLEKRGRMRGSETDIVGTDLSPEVVEKAR